MTQFGIRDGLVRLKYVAPPSGGLGSPEDPFAWQRDLIADTSVWRGRQGVDPRLSNVPSEVQVVRKQVVPPTGGPATLAFVVENETPSSVGINWYTGEGAGGNLLGTYLPSNATGVYMAGSGNALSLQRYDGRVIHSQSIPIFGEWILPEIVYRPFLLGEDRRTTGWVIIRLYVGGWGGGSEA